MASPQTQGSGNTGSGSGKTAVIIGGGELAGLDTTLQYDDEDSDTNTLYFLNKITSTDVQTDACSNRFIEIRVYN